MTQRRASAMGAMIICSAALAGSTPAVAKPDKSVAQSMAIGPLVDCRKISDDAARLVCYDREVAAFDAAVRAKDVAVVNRADIRNTRRSLFGIPLPSIKLFSNDDEPELKQVTSVIRSVGHGEGGRVVVTLDDGAVWAQTDDYPIYDAVKPGQKVTLKRGAFGSYFADFEKAVTVRAKRIR